MMTTRNKEQDSKLQHESESITEIDQSKKSSINRESRNVEVSTKLPLDGRGFIPFGYPNLPQFHSIPAGLPYRCFLRSLPSLQRPPPRLIAMAPFDNNNIIINTDYCKPVNGLQRSESSDCQPLPYYIHRNESYEDDSDMKRAPNSPDNYYSEYHHHQHQQFSQSTYPPHDYGYSIGYHHHHHHHSFSNTDDENEDHGSTASTPQRSNQSSKTLTGASAYVNNKNSHNRTWGNQTDNPSFFYPTNYGIPHSGSHQVEKHSNSVASRGFSGQNNYWKPTQCSAGERLYQYRPESSPSQYFLEGRCSYFSGWQQSEGFGTSEVYSYYPPTTAAREDHVRFNLASVDGGDDPGVTPIPVPPTTPHSALRARVPNKVTPSSGEPIRRKGGDSDEGFMKSLAPPSSTDSYRPKESDSSTTTRDTSKYVALRDLDIVVGRGAPTNYHIGNAHFQDLVAEYRVSYFCAKRSDKPQIAMEIMDVLKERGSRFVRREKGGRQVGASWMVVSSKLAYEKVCAALRDGAPQVQHHLMSSSQKIRETLFIQHQEEQKQKGAMGYSEGNFTDTSGDLEKENGHNLKHDTFQK